VICYLDTSAAMKLLVEEAESVALVGYLGGLDDSVDLVASWLLHTELYCAAGRHPEEVDPDSVAQVLDSLTLVDLNRGDLQTAAALPGRLRSGDAIHLAVALRVGADEMVTYDAELASGTGRAGLRVVAPG
jgi:predicted nucleic acid-binding protein